MTGKDKLAPSSTTPENRPGARARLDLHDWAPDDLRRTFMEDIQRGFELLKKLPPAISFFGGARIKPDDPYYALSKEIGRRLAESGVPPRTGGGPGIMSSVPEGYKEGLQRAPADHPAHFHPVISGFSEQAAKEDHRTQGFNIVLPHEQALNPAIDVSEELQLFPYRKLALYENVRGVVTFPGGFGTLDELFEVWSLAARGHHNDPLAAVGVEFWGPILDAVERVAVKDRALISPDDFARMKLTDDVDALMNHLGDAHGVRGFEGDPDQLAAQLSQEISDAIDVLDDLPEAVTFIGGRGLAADDAACQAARAAAEALTRAGVPLRVGGLGAPAAAVAQGARAADAGAEVQGFIIEAEDGGKRLDGVKVHMSVMHPITHKQLVGRRNQAFVALPGGLGGLDELFTVLCQVQTGKLPRMPLVLVGKDYWQPILDAIRAQMLSGSRQTIAPGDLELVTVTDDPDEITRLITSLD